MSFSLQQVCKTMFFILIYYDQNPISFSEYCKSHPKSPKNYSYNARYSQILHHPFLYKMLHFDIIFLVLSIPPSKHTCLEECGRRLKNINEKMNKKEKKEKAGG